MSEQSNQAKEKPSADAAQSKTLWHRLVGRWVEMILGVVEGLTVLLETSIMSGSPRADILILRRNSPAWTEEQLRYLPDGLRDTTAADVILEWKVSESVNQDAFRQAIGYDFFYQDAQNLKPEALQTFVIGSQTPQDETLRRFGYTQSVKPGVYYSNNPLLARIPLLILNQLSDAPYNAYFKIFASRQRVRLAAFERVGSMGWRRLPVRVLQFLLGLKKHYDMKGEDAMKEELTPDSILEIGAAFREQLLATASLRELNPELREQLLATATPQERQQILSHATPQERLAGLNPEEMAALLTEIEAMLGKHGATHKPKHVRGRKRKV